MSDHTHKRYRPIVAATAVGAIVIAASILASSALMENASKTETTTTTVTITSTVTSSQSSIPPKSTTASWQQEGLSIAAARTPTDHSRLFVEILNTGNVTIYPVLIFINNLSVISGNPLAIYPGTGIAGNYTIPQSIDIVSGQKYAVSIVVYPYPVNNLGCTSCTVTISYGRYDVTAT